MTLARARAPLRSLSRAAAAVSIFAALSSGCAPPCGQLCNKLERCGVNREVTQLECRRACERELSAARDARDRPLRAQLRQHRVCLANRSCEAILDGVCYDPELFPFEESPAE